MSDIENEPDDEPDGDDDAGNEPDGDESGERPIAEI
jgi:hypothetical protein